MNCGVGEDSCWSLLDWKEIQPVHLKGNQFWIFIGRTDTEGETPILWPPDEKNWLIWKDPDAGKDWRQEEKGMTEDEMVGWHHRLDGYGFEEALGAGNGQGSLACCSPWGPRVRHDWATEQLSTVTIQTWLSNSLLWQRLQNCVLECFCRCICEWLCICLYVYVDRLSMKGWQSKGTFGYLGRWVGWPQSLLFTQRELWEVKDVDGIINKAAGQTS